MEARERFNFPVARAFTYVSPVRWHCPLPAGYRWSYLIAFNPLLLAMFRLRGIN